MQDAVSSSSPPLPSASVLPDQLPMVRHLDPAAALAFRTPVWDQPGSADGKAAAILTLLGLMFTILGRSSGLLGGVLERGGWGRGLVLVLLGGFALLAFAAVVQAFRTISPRFPKVPPSLAFFGDIARLKREEYIEKVEGLTAEQAIDQMLLYNHTVSVIIIEKFKQLRRALKFFKGAVGCWLLLMALLGWSMV